jgi:hypothetical protein
MNVESKTIREFIETFEKLFGTYLRHTNGPRHTNFFEIRPGSKKYSDWDLRCFLVDEVEFGQVLQMVKFIESYAAFDDLGHFMTDAEEFADTGWHIARPKVIQIMAIVKDESHAPFFDLSIRNVKDSYVKRLFQKSFNDEFISWAMLTAWRKIRNNNLIGRDSFAWITGFLLLPYFRDKKDKKAILSKPQEFFASKLRGRYKRAVDFLQK